MATYRVTRIGRDGVADFTASDPTEAIEIFCRARRLSKPVRILLNDDGTYTATCRAKFGEGNVIGRFSVDRRS